MKTTTDSVNVYGLSVGDIVTYFEPNHRKTITGKVKKLLQEEGRRRAIVSHSGEFSHFFDVNIGCFALTKV